MGSKSDLPEGVAPDNAQTRQSSASYSTEGPRRHGGTIQETSSPTFFAPPAERFGDTQSLFDDQPAMSIKNQHHDDNKNSASIVTRMLLGAGAIIALFALMHVYSIATIPKNCGDRPDWNQYNCEPD